MSKLEELEQKPRDKRSPIEQCILDAARLEDEHDGDTAIMELAIAELDALREKRLEGISSYDIANAAVDELFVSGDRTTAHRLALKDVNGKDHGGWAKTPARDIILKHIRTALKGLL